MYRYSPHASGLLREPFAHWIRRNALDSWMMLLMRASRQIEPMARHIAIDWRFLRIVLPPPGEHCWGKHVPRLPGYQPDSSGFVWYLQVDQHGLRWPCLVFISGQPGDIQQLFNGHHWARTLYEQQAPLLYRLDQIAQRPPSANQSFTTSAATAERTPERCTQPAPDHPAR